ncbi:MAG: tetratricopeptide repeat protein [Deltaproteobacteria bacterium]|nr:tetratricopeptide repeat protein [Deltaproteobacteria bacterium]
MFSRDSLKGLKILVVDDQSSIRRTIRNILRYEGGCRDIKEAEDGEKALAMLRQDPFDLIICDWNMPRLNGLDLLRLIRDDDQLKSLPFLMVTGEVDAATMTEAAETSVDSYVIKPFGPRTLMEKVNQVISRKKLPTQTDISLNLAMTYLESGEYDKAMDQAQAAAKLDPGSPRTYYTAGLIFAAKGEYQKAEKVFLKALDISPRYVRALDRLVKLYEQMGTPEKGLVHLEAAAEISPRNVDRQIKLGEMVLTQGEQDKARQIFSFVQRISDQNTAQVSKRIGDIYLNNKMYVDAAVVFEKSAALAPKDAHVYNCLGISYRKSKRYDDALASYQKALSLTPEDEVIYYNIGRIYLEMGNKQSATESFQKALNLNPDFPEAKEVLEQLNRKK